MNQQNSGGNNIQFGNVGSGNVFHLSQSGALGPHVQLQLDQQSVREHDKSVLQTDRLQGWIKMALVVISVSVGFAADTYGLADKLSFSAWWIFVPVAALLGWWSLRHLKSWRILGGLPKVRGEANFIGNNEIVQAGDDGKVFVYTCSAPCIYPNCSGKILLTPAPPRESARIGRNYVGICSECARDHTYRLDHNWNAYPQYFDWRPLESGTPSTARP